MIRPYGFGTAIDGIFESTGDVTPTHRDCAPMLIGRLYMEVI